MSDAPSHTGDVQDRDDITSEAATALAEPPVGATHEAGASAGSMIVFESVTKIYEPDVAASEGMFSRSCTSSL